MLLVPSKHLLTRGTVVLSGEQKPCSPDPSPGFIPPLSLTSPDLSSLLKCRSPSLVPTYIREILFEDKMIF